MSLTPAEAKFLGAVGAALGEADPKKKLALIEDLETAQFDWLHEAIVAAYPGTCDPFGMYMTDVEQHACIGSTPCSRTPLASGSVSVHRCPKHGACDYVEAPRDERAQEEFNLPPRVERTLEAPIPESCLCRFACVGFAEHGEHDPRCRLHVEVKP